MFNLDQYVLEGGLSYKMVNNHLCIIQRHSNIIMDTKTTMHVTQFMT